MSICDGCGYNLGNACQVLNNKQTESCFAKASKDEVIRREKDIEDYAFRFEEREFRNSSVRQKLDKKFMELYKQNYSDLKISQLLKISEQSVGNYRRNLALPSNKKQPAGTGK